VHHVLLLLGCAVVIYLCCEWFVNAVEWLGRQLAVGPLAVGTVLAAVGTALPESVVTLVAVTVGSGSETSVGRDIGVGAALGGPLVVGTISYAAVGATLLLRRVHARNALARALGNRPDGPGPARLPKIPLAAGVDPGEITGVDARRLARDQTWFLAIFLVKIALGLVAFAFKPWFGVLFFAVYALYFWREMQCDSDSQADELEPLRLQPKRVVPSRPAVIFQTVVTLVLIFVASQLFVRQLEWAGPALGLSPVVVALLLSPVATELPETMNALIWVRQGKTQLAMANISGSMMIQATIPSGLGLLFTPWHFTESLLLAGVVTVLAVSYLLVQLRTNTLTSGRLTATALFYSGFAAVLASLG
jgi:cation:H+ antiporter